MKSETLLKKGGFLDFWIARNLPDPTRNLTKMTQFTKLSDIFHWY